MTLSDFKWYIINAMAGYENKTAKLIQEEADKKSMSEMIESIVVPMREVLENKRGKKVKVQKKIFPGYVLIKSRPDEAVWSMIRNVNYVAKFLGGKNRPRALSQREIDDIFENIEEIKIQEENKEIFTTGEFVKIIEGPFEGFTALIDSVDDRKKMLKVSVSIFSRETLLELNFDQVKKKETSE